MSAALADDRRHLSDPAGQIDALDGIRGGAVILVLLSHAGLRRLGLTDPWSIGKAGVYLFFVLSAFLLTLGFLRKGATSLAGRELVLYTARRFLRIYPLFVLVLAITCLRLEGVRHGASPQFDLSKFWANLTLQRGDGVFWTIAVEFKYYLVIPAIAFAHLIILRSRWIASVVALGAAAAAAAAAWPLPAGAAPVETVSLAPFLPIFLAGSLAAILFHHFPAGLWRSIAAVLAWAAAIGAAALVSAVPIAVFGAPEHEVGRWIAVWAALWSAMILGALAGRPLLRRLFEVGLLRRAGQLCLGVYLFHLPIAWAVRLYGPKIGVGNRYLVAALAVALTFALAELSLRLLERPLSQTTGIERWARGPARSPVGAALAEEPPASSGAVALDAVAMAASRSCRP
jgi:peptidoglycan/LPS O-acetylase OafA/YrhL